MDISSLNSEFWGWVDAHINDDPIRLRLKYHETDGKIDYDAAILQIECRRRFGKKLSRTLATDNRFYFPSKLAGEQSTSDLLAEYHASLAVARQPLIDLTSGLGIDVMHCAGVCSHVRAIERNHDLSDGLIYNIDSAGIKNVDVVCGDCREEIKKLIENGSFFGTAFIDPARRAEDGSRVFSLSECEPDVTTMLKDLAQICRRLIVKMSPMLDITHTIGVMDGCKRIIALGTTTECKELIAIKEFGDTGPYTIDATTLLTSGQISFCFTQAEENDSPIPDYTLPAEGDFFYEPYPAVMKSGANKVLTSQFGLSAFHPNGRYYHSSQYVDDFPGEVFVIEAVIDFSSKYLKRFSRSYPVINVSARNFGMSADSLRTKLGVKEGGDKRVIGITDINNVRKLIVIHKR